MKAHKTEKVKDKCGECHSCCQFFLITLSEVPNDFMQFIHTWGISTDKNGDSVLLKIYSPCQHLTKDGCDIYQQRPIYCRDYQCENRS